MSFQRTLTASVFFFVMLGFVSPAQSGTARLLGLGGDGNYFTDSTNVLQWYSSLENYPNQCELELGDFIKDGAGPLASLGLIGHGGGVHVRLKEDSGWGTAAAYYQDQLTYGHSDGEFSAFWSRSLGVIQLGLGGRFSTYGRSQIGTEVGDGGDSQYFHQYGVGLSGEVADGFRLEGAGEIINSMSSKLGALYSLALTNEWSSYGLRFRGFIDAAPEVVLVPVVEYTRKIHAQYDAVFDGPVDRDAYTTKLGMGANITTKKNLLLLVSCEYRRGNERLVLRPQDSVFAVWNGSDRSFYQIRFRTGIESSITPWLTARASISYVRVHDESYWFSNGLYPRKENVFFEGVKTPVALGISLHYGAMTADLTYNDTALLDSHLASEEYFMGDGVGYSALTLGWKF